MKNSNQTENTAEVLRLMPIGEESYRDLDLDRLLTYALATMESKEIPLFFDLLVIAAFRLFPKKFSMATFEQFPDTSRIDKAARRLADSKRKGWATGNIENGFNLTDLGREVAREVTALLQSPEPVHKPLPTTRSRGRSSDNEIRELYSSPLFKAWSGGEKKSPHEVLSFLKATPYTPTELLAKRLNQLRQSAFDTHNEKIGPFLDWIEESLNIKPL